jgi:hypothetical protein
VIPELEALGHRAIAVDLPCTDPAAMLEDYARTVVEAMAGIEGPVVVVGQRAAAGGVGQSTGRNGAEDSEARAGDEFQASEPSKDVPNRKEYA